MSNKNELPRITGEIEQLICCPECNSEQLATAVLLEGEPFWSYVHKCTICGYVIMESEWEVVEPSPVDRPALIPGFYLTEPDREAINNSLGIDES